MKTTCYEEWWFDCTLFFLKVSVHFYGLAPTGDNCVYMPCQYHALSFSYNIVKFSFGVSHLHQSQTLYHELRHYTRNIMISNFVPCSQWNYLPWRPSHIAKFSLGVSHLHQSQTLYHELRHYTRNIMISNFVPCSQWNYLPWHVKVVGNVQTASGYTRCS